MRKFKLFALLFFLFLGAVFLSGCSDFQRPKEMTFLQDSSQVEAVWLSRGIDALWLRRGADLHWQIGDVEPADESRVRTLLEILSALRCEMPLPEDMSDSLARGLFGEGLQVRVEYEELQTDNYTLFTGSDKYLYAYNPARKNGWTVSLLGFSSDFVSDLSLRGRDWRPLLLGISKPSDLERVELRRRDDPHNSFRIDLDSNLHARLFKLNDSISDLPANKEMISVFLHTLTAMKSYPLIGDARNIARKQVEQLEPSWELSLRMRSGRQKRYSIYRKVDAEKSIGSAKRGLSFVANEGFLVVDDSEVRRILLSDWDATLPTIDVLRK